MVSFVCDACQETLKKAKLDQHKYRCQWATFSCIDCSTSFQGNDYKSHTSCVSEAEKYQKALYKGPKHAGKGDKQKKGKQEVEAAPPTPAATPGSTNAPASIVDQINKLDEKENDAAVSPSVVPEQGSSKRKLEVEEKTDGATLDTKKEAKKSKKSKKSEKASDDAELKHAKKSKDSKGKRKTTEETQTPKAKDVTSLPSPLPSSSSSSSSTSPSSNTPESLMSLAKDILKKNAAPLSLSDLRKKVVKNYAVEGKELSKKNLRAKFDDEIKLSFDSGNVVMQL